ncbi:MAG: NAD(P)H-hydrate dehydratase [Synergistaceae bacterium]|nr:NAD(P)H-hydrate dehydratase [Synergistaceae bacterium]
MNKGFAVTVILSSEPETYKGDAKRNLDLLIRSKSNNCTAICSKQLTDEDIIEKISKADCLIDSLLGTGSKGAPRGEVGRLIKHCLNRAVVAFDIPSGIDPANGNIFDSCIRADMTVTFLAAKKGMCFSPAYDMCGTVVTADIGISPDKVLDGKETISSFGRKDISKLMPAISRNIHKGDRGGLLIVGGSINYRGAPLLAGLGALRSGAGLAVLAVPDFMVDSASILLPEAILVPLKTKGETVLPESVAEAIAPWKTRCGAAVVGPGLGRNQGAQFTVDWFWKNWNKPLLVDGDGLYFLSFKKYLPAFRANAVLTPHSGEAAALLGITPEDINRSRSEAAVSMSRAAGTILLKGMDTVVYSKGKEITIIKGGSPALAVPGSGDVLSGAAGALIASGMPVFDAVLAGAAAHAAAGALIEKRSGVRGTLAREIADALPFAFN